jgi:hypothetical protein
MPSLVAVACFLPGRAKDLSAPLYSVLSDYLCVDYVVCWLPRAKLVMTKDEGGK